jgi:hypothetical protein
MSTGCLLTGRLSSAAIRRKRRDNGSIFAVARIRDSDRGVAREWVAFANDLLIIEQLEEMRVGEPIACSGPFYVAVDGDALAYRLTIEALVDTKRRRKPKGLIAKESRVESDELNIAPVAEEPNDAIPF